MHNNFIPLNRWTFYQGLEKAKETFAGSTIEKAPGLLPSLLTQTIWHFHIYPRICFWISMKKMPNILLHICLTPFSKWRAGGREGRVQTAPGPTGPAARLGCKWHNVNEFNIQLSFVWKLYVCILVTFTIVSSRCCKFTCVSYQMLALFNMYCKVQNYLFLG